MIRLLIAEDHGVVRAGLEQLFATTADIVVVATAADGAEATRLAAQHSPDVILMDLSMPNVDGRQATERILASSPAARIVILTSFSDRREILGALDAGAVGYLLKDAEPADLLEGVRGAARGESPLAPEAAHTLVAERHAAPPGSELTDREREVLALLGDGLPNKLIAQRLSISEKTVKAHVTRIFHAIGVSDRTQAALWVHQRDLTGDAPRAGQPRET